MRSVYLTELCLAFRNASIKMKFISVSAKPACNVCRASSGILKSLGAGLCRLSSGSGHIAGLVVCSCGSCPRQQTTAAPGILPAVFWELAQVLSLLVFPSFVNGVMVAVRYWEGHEDLPSSLLFDIAAFTILLVMDKNWFSV